MEVNKEEIRRKCLAAISPDSLDPVIIFSECVTPAKVVALLDELDQATLQCAKHGKALQEIGAALSLNAGYHLHKECVPGIYRLFQSIGSGVTEAYKERMACQEVIDQLREELAGIKNVNIEVFQALKNLTMHARTSGGTAGPDAGLMAACEQAEKMLSLGGIGRAYMEGADSSMTREGNANS